MEAFLAFNEFLVAISVLISAISSYLIVNKLWSRRTKKDVAESISVSAALLGLFTGFPFLVQFVLVDHSTGPALKSGIGIATGVVFVLIGSGLWVPEYRGRGFLALLRQALRLEKEESTDLVKALVQPKAADLLLDIFQDLAHVDAHLDEREAELLRDFADRWHLTIPDLDDGVRENGSELSGIREKVATYLAMKPPPDQAAELVDVMRAFVQADETVSAEEELIVEEVQGMVAEYLSEDAEGGASHEVLIVPQSDEQTQAVRELLPRAEVKTVRGGRVFSVGRFFSPRYAERICDQYIALGLFTASVEVP